jgi:hypothetical protein
VIAPVHIDEALRPGLTFMTFHFPDDVATNKLTNDKVDPLVGTAEFKATAVCIEADGIPDSRRDELSCKDVPSRRDQLEGSRH